MTIPAGLVKLISQAPGASRAIRSARSTMVGIVRSAKQMPPGTGGLLAEHAVAERDSLVDGTALEPADADRRKDEIGALERVVEVGGRAERHAIPVLRGLTFEHVRDPVEPPGDRRRRARQRQTAAAAAGRRTRAGRGSRRPQ